MMNLWLAAMEVGPKRQDAKTAGRSGKSGESSDNSYNARKRRRYKLGGKGDVLRDNNKQERGVMQGRDGRGERRRR